jgi:hypothetical protein
MTSDVFIINLNGSAGHLKLDLPGNPSGKKAFQKPGEKNKSLLWAYPFAGTINLSAKSFSLGNYTWKPVYAKISKDQNQIKIQAIRAGLCGIDTPGTLLWDGKSMQIDFQCIAKDQDFLASYACLSKNRIEMSGIYDLSAQINAFGPIDDFRQSLIGQFDFKASDGVITKDKRLSRLLEVISFAEILKGNIPDLKTEGFHYKTINIQGEYLKDEVVFEKIVMDGKTLELFGKGTFNPGKETLNIELLAAPFKTVDYAIKAIPGVNYLMAGNLIAIPLHIKGNVNDPEVTILETEDLNAAFLDFVERTINSPVKLIEQLNPYKKSKSE